MRCASPRPGSQLCVNPTTPVGPGVLFGFEPCAEGGDAVLDKVQARTLHDIVLGVVRGGDDFFGDAEGGADLSAGKFAIFEELEIGAGELES